MQNLTPQQAQALWDAGGFIILPNLPERSEYGLDGTYHTIRNSFNGSKFVPPGLHLIVISPNQSTASVRSNVGPGAITLRSGVLVYMKPRERIVLNLDPKTESLTHTSHPESQEDVISDDHLRALDPGLAAYPFDGLEAWKSLTSALTDKIIIDVLGSRISGIDGMRGVEGDKEDLAATGDEDVSGIEEGGDRRKLRFVQYDLRRSWRDGAVGEEVTRYSRDKSYLLGQVISRLNGDTNTLLAHLQLAFISVLHLSSPACLTVYKRIFTLFARSSQIHLRPSEYISSSRHADLRATYINLVLTLTAQVQALPDSVFDTELPELDVWFNEEFEYLRRNLGSAIGVEGSLWVKSNEQELLNTWEAMRVVARQKFGWQIGALSGLGSTDRDLYEEEEDEEGEYAPVIVEIREHR